MKKINFIIAILATLFINVANAQVKITNPNVAKQVQQALVTKKMTNFNPAIHGFKFANTFSNELNIAGLNGPRLSGYCAGMAYAALDYYNSGISIPSQNFRPLKGTPLYEYIFTRQMNANLWNADKWAELITNPFGWRTDEFFNWGLQGSNGGRIQELKEFIDNGKPVPIGLFKGGNGGFNAHHEVLAIGYDMGRYKGDLGNFKEDFKIYICDANFPNQTMTLAVNPSTQSYYYLEDPSCNWLTYFVDKKCNASTPPRIANVVLPNDGLVRVFNIEIRTGGDDLRGGNDNVHAIVNYTDGTSDKYENINLRQRWINNYCETVTLNLRKPAKLNQIRSISFQTTFGGGIGGDNWNVDGIMIVAKEGNSERWVFNQVAYPIVRFDGNNRPFEAIFRY